MQERKDKFGCPNKNEDTITSQFPWSGNKVYDWQEYRLSWVLLQLIFQTALSIKEIKRRRYINTAALLFGCRMEFYFFYQIVKIFKKNQSREILYIPLVGEAWSTGQMEFLIRHSFLFHC